MIKADFPIASPNRTPDVTQHLPVIYRPPVAPQAPAPGRTPSSASRAVEQRLHASLEDGLDRWFGDERNAQLHQLNGSGAAAGVLTEEQRGDNRFLLFTGLNAGAAMLLGLTAPAWLFLCVPVSAYLLRDQLHLAWQRVREEGRLNVHILDVTAVAAASLAGYWQVTAISQFCYALALKLRNRAKQRSQRALTGIFAQTPATLWILCGSVETEIALADLPADAIVVVRAGETIPVDGVIVNGAALIDQRALTGEAQPAEKQAGDAVLAATLLLSGRLELRVQSSGRQTVVARIGRILQQTAGYKNRHESQAEEFVDRTAAPTLALGALAVPFFGLSGAIGVLWSSFGYTMRIVAPMSVMNFLRHAAQQRILIKDGAALDHLAQIDTVVFDKTGTLTDEAPTLHRIHVFAHADESAVLAYAAAAEYRQSHPIARAIGAAAHARGLQLPAVADCQCRLGYGIEAVIGGQRIQLGSRRFLADSAVAIPDAAGLIEASAERRGHSLVMLAVDGVLAGAIELRPQLRPGARETIRALQRQGIRTCVISGDRDAPTRRLSADLGIDRYFADTLPEQKAAIVQRMQATNRTVCFIGDGINDAIALAAADVSVSLSGATRAATDTAQIVLMDGDLTQLPTLLELGRRFQRNQHQNLGISVIPAAASMACIFLLQGGLPLAALLFYAGLALGVRNATQPVRLPGAPPRLERRPESGKPASREPPTLTCDAAGAIPAAVGAAVAARPYPLGFPVFGTVGCPVLPWSFALASLPSR